MKLPVLYQRLEAAAILCASIYFYQHLNFNLVIFAVLLFSFDVFIVGYLINKKVGAHIYNIGHSMSVPALLLVAGSATDTRALMGFSLIWFAHIGIDRAFGYGLKFPGSFRETHLGQIGKAK